MWCLNLCVYLFDSFEEWLLFILRFFGCLIDGGGYRNNILYSVIFNIIGNVFFVVIVIVVVILVVLVIVVVVVVVIIGFFCIIGDDWLLFNMK